MDVHGQHYEVGYWPGDSRSDMFGGNSNWRGPICEFLNFSLKTAGIVVGLNFLLGSILFNNINIDVASLLLFFVHRARYQFLVDRESATILSILWR
jgi:hypothetical protein